MEATISDKKENTTREGKKGWQKWGPRFINFLVMGGWVLVAIVVLAILILVSKLTK
jgi:hypothetical protein